jgi:hypothetical protein
MANFFDSLLPGGDPLEGIEGGYTPNPIKFFEDLKPQPERTQRPDEVFVKSAGQAVVGTGAGVLRDIAVMNAGQASRRLDELTTFDETGELPFQLPGKPIDPILELYETAEPDIQQQIRDSLSGRLDPSDSRFYQAGEALQTWGEEIMPIDDEFRDTSAALFGQGAGSLLAFMGLGVAGRAMRVGGATAAAAGAMVGGDSLFQDAVRSGASMEDAFTAAGLGRIVGMSEALPITRMLDRYFATGSMKELVLSPVLGGVEEGAQELFQGMFQSLIASTFVKYDPDRKLFEGAIDNVKVGFSLGALANLAMMIAGGSRRSGETRSFDGKSLEDALAENRDILQLTDPMEGDLGANVIQQPPVLVLDQPIDVELEAPLAEPTVLGGAAAVETAPVDEGAEGFRAAAGGEGDRSYRVTATEAASSLQGGLLLERAEGGKPATSVVVGNDGKLFEVNFLDPEAVGRIWKPPTEEARAAALEVLEKFGADTGPDGRSLMFGESSALLDELALIVKKEAERLEGATPTVPPIETAAPPADPVNVGAPVPEGPATIKPGLYRDTRTGDRIEVTTPEEGAVVIFNIGDGMQISTTPLGVVFRGEADPGAQRFFDGLKSGEYVSATPMMDEFKEAERLEGAAPVEPVADPFTPAAPVTPAADATPVPTSIPDDIPDQLFQGRGGGESSVAVPLVGGGAYYAFNEKDARGFGDDIQRTTLRNDALMPSSPLIIRDGEAWRALTKEAGWPVPNIGIGYAQDQMVEYTDRLQEVVRAKGHDGIIAWWDNKTPYDIGPNGENIKLLRHTFGVPQVIAFDPSQDTLQTPETVDTPLGEPVSEDAYEVFTPEGTSAMVVDTVVPLSSLTTSHTANFTVNPDFPQELQPRDRTRKDLVAQVAEIAGTFNPERVGPGVETATGAPIVGRDGVVESGNGRVMALSRVYGEGRDGEYRQWLEGQGHDITGIVQPVLIRQRVTDMSRPEREAFVAAAGRSPVATKSITESAAEDATRLPDHVMDLYQGGGVQLAQNRDFVRRFIDAVVPQTERGDVRTADGELSQNGRARIESAMFIKAYGDPEFLAALRESSSTTLKAIGEAMVDVAPAWAQMRAQIAAGEVQQDMDTTEFLLEAVEVVRQSRNKKMPVSDVLASEDMFAGDVSLTARAFLEMFFKGSGYTRQRSRPVIAQHLLGYTEEAGKASGQPSMFTGTTINPRDVIRTVIKLVERRRFGMIDEKGGIVAMRPADRNAAIKAYGIKKGPLPTSGNSIGDAFWRGYIDGPTRRGMDAKGSPAWHGFRAGVLRAKNEPGLDSNRLRKTGQPDGRPHRKRAREGEVRSRSLGPGGMTAGVNYRGPIQFSTVQEGQETESVKRGPIITALADVLGTSVYQGRIGGRTTLGFFRPSNREVRVKHMGDIETVAHEMAHLMDDLDDAIRQQWLGTGSRAVVVEELRGLSYDDTKIFEGFAEFVRHWMTDKAYVQEKAPEFSQWWESYLDRIPQGPGIRKAQKDMHAYFAQPSIQRARQKIGEPNEKTSDSHTSSWRDVAGQVILNDARGMYGFEKAVLGSIEPGGPTQAMRALRGNQLTLTEVFNQGRIVYNGEDSPPTFEGKGLVQIIDPIYKDLEDWLMFIVGKSANELWHQSREHSFTRDEIDAMLQLGDGRPDFHAAADEYQVWQNALVKFALHHQVLDPEHVRNWRRNFYVNFRRMAVKGSVGSKPTGEFVGIRSLTGGTGNLRPILTNIMDNATMLVESALENQVRLKAVALANKKGSGPFLTKIKTTKLMSRIDKDQVERAFWEGYGLKTKEGRIDPPEGTEAVAEIFDQMKPFLTFWMNGQKPPGDNVITVMQQGKPVYYDVGDTNLLRSFLSIHRRTSSVPDFLYFKKLARINRTLVTTSLTFIGRNIQRDAMGSWVFTKTGAHVPFQLAVKGAIQIMSRSQMYQDFIASGGGISAWNMDEHSLRRKMMRQFSHRHRLDPRRLLNPDTLLTFLEQATAIPESAPRVGEFARSRERGEHYMHSAVLGKEVATDFSQRGGTLPAGHPDRGLEDIAGDIINGWFDRTTFMRAATLGLDKAYRTMMNSNDFGDRAPFFKKMLLMSMAGTAITLHAMGTEGYDDITEEEKLLYWHIPIVNHNRKPGESKHNWWRISRPWELGWMAFVFEQTIILGMKSDDRDLANHFKVIAQGAEALLPGVVPTAIKPWWELERNRTFFGDFPILNRSQENLSPWLQQTSRTPRSLVALGEAVRGTPLGDIYSPAKVDHIMKSYFAGWWTYGNAMLDRSLFGDTMPDRSATQTPLVRAFFSNQPPRATQSLGEFYDLIDEIETLKANLRETVKLDELEFAKEFVELAKEKYQDYDAIMVVADNATNIRKLEQHVYVTDDLIELQDFVRDSLAHVKLEGKARLMTLVKSLKNEGMWDDMGALKRFILNDLTMIRNEQVKNLMDIIEANEKVRAEAK